MELGIKDRIAMAMILPKEGDIISQTIVKNILEKTRLTQDDMKKIDMQILPDGKALWVEEKEFEIDVDFSDLEMDLMKKAVDDLVNIRKINQDNLGLCKKIQDEKKAEEQPTESEDEENEE